GARHDRRDDSSLPDGSRGDEEGRRRVQPNPTHAAREEGVRLVAGEEPMRALGVFPVERAVRLVTHDSPTIAAPTEVRMRVIEVGVCGTDREICRFDFGTPPAGSDYLV